MFKYAWIFSNIVMVSLILVCLVIMISSIMMILGIPSGACIAGGGIVTMLAILVGSAIIGFFINIIFVVKK